MAENLNTKQVESVAKQVLGQACLISDNYQDNGLRIVIIAVGKKLNPYFDPQSNDPQMKSAPQFVNDERIFHMTVSTTEQAFADQLNKLIPTLPPDRSIDEPVKEVKPTMSTIASMTPNPQVTPTPLTPPNTYKPTGPNGLAGMPVVVDEGANDVETPADVKHITEHEAVIKGLGELGSKIDKLVDVLVDNKSDSKKTKKTIKK